MVVDPGFAGVSPVGDGCEGCARLARENRRVRARVSGLEGKVEELRRVGKRQAAPFSRDEWGEGSSGKPGRPGRKPGSGYGKNAHRPVPEEVDETVEAPLGDGCECGGEIEFERVAYQLPVSGGAPQAAADPSLREGAHRAVQVLRQAPSGPPPLPDLGRARGGRGAARAARGRDRHAAEQGAWPVAAEDRAGA